MAGHDHPHDTAHMHGTMEIRDHERTFAAFIRTVTWGAGLVIGILIFLALVNA